MNKWQYRLGKTANARNIVIERKREGRKTWVAIAYCGNSIKAVLRELSELIVKEYIPDENQELSGQLKELSRIVEEGYDKLEIALKKGELLEIG